MKPHSVRSLLYFARLNHPCCGLRTCVCKTPCPCGSENECAYKGEGLPLVEALEELAAKQ